MRGKILYYVEGETEVNLIKSIKNEYIVSGKVKKFDFWEEDFSIHRIREIDAHNVIIIFDTDKHNTESKRFNCFKNNIDKISKCTQNIILISQSNNLEDEIVCSTNISHILNFYELENISKHKSKFANDSKLLSKLLEKDFDMNKMWKNDLLEQEYINKKVKHGKTKILK